MCEMERYQVIDNNGVPLTKSAYWREIFTFHFYWNMAIGRPVFRQLVWDLVYRGSLKVCSFNKYFALKLWWSINQQNWTSRNFSFLTTLILTFSIPFFVPLFYFRHLLFYSKDSQSVHYLFFLFNNYWPNLAMYFEGVFGRMRGQCQ